jgi:hypothetical protein
MIPVHRFERTRRVESQRRSGCLTLFCLSATICKLNNVYTYDTESHIFYDLTTLLDGVPFVQIFYALTTWILCLRS